MTRFNRPVVLGAGAVIVVLVLIWWFLLWSPRNRAYNAAAANAQAAQAQVDQLQSQYDRLNSIKQRIPQLQAELAKIHIAIPDKPELDQIILDINGAAAQSGMELDSIAPTPPAASTGAANTATAGGAPPFIRVSLALKGGYTELLDFMDRLDSLPRLIVIDTVSASAGTGGSASAELSVSITVRLFVTTAPATAGSGTTTTTAPPGGTTTTTVPGATTTTTHGATTTTAGAVTGG